MTVLPSSLLSPESGGETGVFDHNFKNFSLKSGVIIGCHELEDPKNINKLGPEYDVSVYEQDEDRGITSTIYSNCTYLESFGAIGDFLEVKKRIPTKGEYRSDQKADKQNGAMVLLLCIDGISDKGIIIGGISHPSRKSILTEALGHHLEGEFNGVNWQINKDGALTVTFRSATDNDGKQADAKAAGSTLKMEKDGSVEVSDGNKETIRVDKTKKTISITSESDISTTSDANINLTAKKSINAKATDELLADAGGSITAKSGGAFNITSEGALMIKASSIDMKSDESVKIKGTMVNISSPMINVGDGGTPAVTMSTQVLTVVLGIPLMGNMIGPFSSSVFIGS